MTEEMDPADRADLYVLGLLDPAEVAETERLAAEDPGLAATIAATRRRFAPIDETVEPVAPSAQLWSRIEQAIDATPAQSPAAQPRPQPEMPVDAAPGAPVLPRAPAGPTAPASVPPALRQWRLTALTALAASTVLAVALAVRLLTPTDPQVIAVLLDDTNTPIALVEDFGGDRQRLVSLATPEKPGQSTFQVWTKWSDEVGPVSLGVLNDLRTVRLDGEGLPPPRAGQLYEITLEGPGGSPTGLPTGPIVGIGLGKPPIAP